MLPFTARLALRNLSRHRTRSLISLSAIAFGVVAMLLAGGFTEWIFWAMRESAIQTGLGHVQVTRPGFRDAGTANPSAYRLPANSPAFSIVRSTPGAAAVDERLLFAGLASFGETTLPFTGLGVDPIANRLISPALPVVGKNLDAVATDGVLVGRGLAAALGVVTGDRVALVVTLPAGGISAVEAIVSGTFATQVKAYDDTALRVPIALARKLLRVTGSNIWVVGLDVTDGDTRAATEYLRLKLPDNEFEIATWFDLSDFYKKAVVLLSRQIDVVAFLIGAIIVLGISNTLAMNVFERTGEIGTLMAMGTLRREVLQLFLLEGFFLGVLGGLAGLAIGLALTQVISFVGIPMPPPPGRDTGYSARIIATPFLTATALAMAILATTLASVYPAWRAARLRIVDALRHNV